MILRVYTTDQDKKRRYCKDVRKKTESWRQTVWLMWMNNAAMIAFIGMAVYAMTHNPSSFAAACAAVFFTAFLSVSIHVIACSDVNNLFMSRIDETIVYLENGDLIYAYKTANKDRKTRSTVILKMENKNIREISRNREPNMMIFTGCFSKTVTADSNTVHSLMRAIRIKNCETVNGSILCPDYIVPNNSMTRLLNKFYE